MPYNSIYKPDLLKGQTIIVTGGGSGIGRCTAHELASLGAHVVLTGRKPDKLEKVQAEIVEDGGSAEWAAFDIREEERVKEAIAGIVAKNGPIHGLVNNAGGQFPARLEDISQRGWDAVVRNNLTGGFLVAREVFNQSMKAHGGAIVNITADNWFGMPIMGHSGAARAGMVNFTETAALEWSPFGVRVNVVAPGVIASSGMDTYDGPVREAMRTRHREIPFNRMGTEAEVSSAIVYLLTPGAAYITGSVLRVDGGSPLARVGWPMPEHNRATEYQGFHRYQKPKVLQD
ncbi:MAG: SDR family oxidoreductase [Rhodospirillales bacterium]